MQTRTAGALSILDASLTRMCLDQPTGRQAPAFARYDPCRLSLDVNLVYQIGICREQDSDVAFHPRVQVESGDRGSRITGTETNVCCPNVSLSRRQKRRKQSGAAFGGRLEALVGLY